MYWGFLSASCMGEETVCVKLKKSDINKKFYSVHIAINYTDKDCMTSGEKQEMHYHR